MTEDWDTLIILDGCRYDTFEKYRHKLAPDGTLSKRVSPASSSMEFMEATFAEEEFHDTVYVTANPHVEFLKAGTFHHVRSLLDEEFWDADRNTVRPETVVVAAREARDEFPNKRLIAHFMQPHYPFIGPKGDALPHRGFNQSMEDMRLEGLSVWQQLRKYPGSLDITDVRAAYEENLELVLEEVDGLIADLSNERIAITADHGNFLGERLWPVPVRDFGHPSTTFAPQTVHVPWFEIEGSERPEIRSDPPIAHEQSYDGETVDSRLSALGYKQ
jgi:hypothetical protein